MRNENRSAVAGRFLEGKSRRAAFATACGSQRPWGGDCLALLNNED